MGRIFEVRKSTMFARWDKMAKQFTRIGKDIVLAVKQGGPLPENNPALRRCILNAKGVNMPKDRIEAAIKRATDKNTANLEEITYEGYGPFGAAIVVETATDNPTRTVANIRMYFTRAGGSLTTSGSMNYVFESLGEFHIKKEDVKNEEEFEFQLIDHGLTEIGENSEGNLVVRCSFTSFGIMSDAISNYNITPISSEVIRHPLTFVNLDEAQAKQILELVDKIEQDEDVQKVYHNLA